MKSMEASLETCDHPSSQHSTSRHALSGYLSSPMLLNVILILFPKNQDGRGGRGLRLHIWPPLVLEFFTVAAFTDCMQQTDIETSGVCVIAAYIVPPIAHHSLFSRFIIFD